VSIPISVDRMSPVPLHRQLYEILRAAILSGKLAPAGRVPSTRELARQLTVARTTVMTAYEQLIADGYLETRHGAWTSVARDLPNGLTIDGERHRSYPRDAAPRITRRAAGLVARAGGIAVPPQDIAYNFRQPFTPAVDLFPVKEWRRLVIEHWSRSGSMAFSILDPVGDPALRHELTGYVRMTRGIDCDADQILITTGSEQAIDLLSRIMLEPGGDRVAIEDPSNLGVRYLYESHDAELVPITVDCDGFVVDELRAVRGRHPAIVHVMPTHQYPTGVMLSLRRRLELLHWAQAHRGLIVEDDYASEFSYEGATLESLQALDTAGVVAYVGTFTKVLSPTIQIGYVILPPSLVAAARAAHRLSARQAEIVHQCVLARFMQDGILSRYLRRLHRVHVARRNALVQALTETFGNEVVIGPATSGLQIQVRWLGLEITPELIDRLEAAGVGVVPVQPLYQRPPAEDSGVVMSFASLEEARIRSGVAVLAAILRDG
jgi:GntR family transcriptional regulator / MocR family aminotransferase